MFYDASVGFYRCTLFHILFCTFYAAFIREFSRFTLLKSSYLYLYSAREILSSGIFATKCIVFPRLAHRPYTKEIEKPRFYRPKARIANPQISRGSGAQRTGYRPTRVLHATAPSSSGPASTHTAKFEPAAWSRAQMTSGSGAPKRVLTEEASSDHIQT